MLCCTALTTACYIVERRVLMIMERRIIISYYSQQLLCMFVSHALHGGDLVADVISCSLNPLYDYDNEDLHVACDLSDLSTSPLLLLLSLFSHFSTSNLLLFLQLMRAGVYVADSYITPPYAAMRKWVKGSAMS